METVTEAPDESTGDSSIVKSENGSTQQDGGRSSPPPNCAICLGRCRNKSFTDSCLHQFCFKCLLTWSRVKTECPLCKQNFKSIIHNVKSNNQYEEYPVEQPQAEAIPPTSLDINEIVNAARRFRYRTTLTLPRRETLAIQQFLLQYPLAALVNNMAPREVPVRDRPRRSPADFRRTVYRHNLWARPLPDFTGRFRDCSPDFFRYNNSQVHRLIPWLNRELYYLLNENSGHISYVMERILELLPRHPIISPEFRGAMHCYFGDRTDHFLHEFHVFASTPYDLTGYDRHVQYQTDSRVSSLVDEVLSSSDSDRDSDIVLVSSSHPGPTPLAVPPAPSEPGPSYAAAPAPRYPRDRIPQPQQDVVPIETISHSDLDSDSSEVMVVGYIKPPHQRTPELVDLLGSDSDVVLQEGPPSPRPAAATTAGSPLVRLTLSRPRRPASVEAHVDSDSDDASYTPPPPPPPRRRRRRTRSQDSTPALTSTLPPSPSPTPEDSPRTPTPFSSDDEDTASGETDESFSSYEARRRKPRRKTSKAKSNTERRAPSRRKDKKKLENRRSEKEQRRGRKSKNGKGVKSSKLTLEEIPLPPEPMPERAGPSGTADQPAGLSETALEPAGPSGAATGRSKRAAAEAGIRRGSRESKRLKSVVKVMKRDSTSSTEGRTSSDSNKSRKASQSQSSTSRRKYWRCSPTVANSRDSDSSSDDNIPLHLTIARQDNIPKQTFLSKQDDESRCD